MPIIENLVVEEFGACLLYTSDAADERSSVDLGGRRIIKKKNITDSLLEIYIIYTTEHALIQRYNSHQNTREDKYPTS